MTRVPTIDYGAGALPTASSLGAADCRTGGSKAGLTTQPREAADPLRTSAQLPEDAGRSATGGFFWFTLELPRPPSVNRFTAKLGNKSPVVQKWIKQCDRYVMAAGRRPHLHGPFEICIWWNIDQFGKFDIDNSVKPLLDYLQRIAVIENDRWCRHLHVMWGPTSLGCRVAVRQWEAA